MEVHLGETPRPICIDVRHVHPLSEWIDEGVVEAFCRPPYLCDSENIINIADNRYALCRYQVGSCISFLSAAGIYIESLWRSSRVTGQEPATADILELHEDIKVSLFGRWIRQSDDLISTCPVNVSLEDSREPGTEV